MGLRSGGRGAFGVSRGGALSSVVWGQRSTRAGQEEGVGIGPLASGDGEEGAMPHRQNAEAELQGREGRIERAIQ